jgi:hypothetical protein
MKCAICGIEVETVEEAIEQDWIPSFYEEMDNEHEAVCSDCAGLFLQVGIDGEMEVKQEYRGKLTYTVEEPAGHWMIGIAMSEVPNQTD